MFASIYAPGNLPILLSCAQQFSPLIEVTSNDMVTLDIRGLGRLYGPPEKIASDIDRGVGLTANIAIAANPDTTTRLAQGTTGKTVVAPGNEGRTLAPLSLNLLGCPARMGETFDLWGIRTFGQFADLPPLGVAARMGEEGTHWQRIAQGVARRELRLFREKVTYEREMELEDRILLLEPLLFLIGRFLGELCNEIKDNALAANQVKLLLGLEKRHEHVVILRLPVPMMDQNALLKLLHLELSQRPPGAAVRKIRLEMEAVQIRKVQEDLFAPAYPAPEQIEITVARIRRFVGEGNIGSPRVLDTHKPDSFVVEPFRPSGQRQQESRQSPIPLAFRRFRPPHRAEVTVTEQPVHVVSVVACGSVQIAKGPWFSSGNWWRTDIWNREDWDVELKNGALYRIFRDLSTKLWFVEGNYD